MLKIFISQSFSNKTLAMICLDLSVVRFYDSNIGIPSEFIPASLMSTVPLNFVDSDSEASIVTSFADMLHIQCIK